MEEIEKALERVKSSLGERDHEFLRNLVDAYAYVTELVEDKDTSIRKLRRILFGAATERKKNVLDEEKSSEPGGNPDPASAGDEKPSEGNSEEVKEKKKRPGHGRNGADDYTGAERTKVPQGSLHHGDGCPHAGCRGKLYALPEPGVIVRVKGAVPIQARVWELEKLRCNLCLEIFTAKAPEGIGEKKYDETAAAMLATLRYGSGLPFNGIEKLERNAGSRFPPGPSGRS
jgi:transposase